MFVQRRVSDDFSRFGCHAAFAVALRSGFCSISSYLWGHIYGAGEDGFGDVRGLVDGYSSECDEAVEGVVDHGGFFEGEVIAYGWLLSALYLLIRVPTRRTFSIST